jgi:hypothetical protein
MTEETLCKFEAYCANRLVSIFIALSSVRIVQYLFNCSSVIMMGTSRTRGCEVLLVVNFRSSNAYPVAKRRKVAESLWLAGMEFLMTVFSISIKGATICTKSLYAETLIRKKFV